MRTLIFDQFEFDSMSSEESLEIDVAEKLVGNYCPFPTVRDFVARAAGVATAARLRDPSPYNDVAGFSSIRAYLKRFANIDVPDPCDWQMYVLQDDESGWHGVLEAPATFIRYYWSSTA